MQQISKDVHDSAKRTELRQADGGLQRFNTVLKHFPGPKTAVVVRPSDVHLFVCAQHKRELPKVKPFVYQLTPLPLMMITHRRQHVQIFVFITVY